ncbi:MAG: type IV pilus secretin PilQ family protein [Xanthomonadales bacterium]|nr:type IV pilus secretin PilQ family protein [Xanthomonadales bacterium]
MIASAHIQNSCRPLAAAATILALLLAPAAFASNILESVDYVVAGGGRVDIRMTLAEARVDARDFATDSPARIAVDLIDTRNAWAERRLPVGSGAVSAVSAVESGGRTRLVVDLLRPASYSLRQEGPALVLSVESGVSASGGSATIAAETDPTKRPAIAARNELDRVDFRRGSNGEGRLQLVFTGESVGADMREFGNRLQLELANVRVPERNIRRLDVTDFATPVQFVDIRAVGDSGARIEIGTSGAIQTLAYQTGNQYVVEVAEKREPTAAERRLKTPEYSGQRVTFNFQDIPVRSVLQLIADVSELNVVVADSVQGNITLRLVNVPWDQALDIILQAKGLDKRTQGNVIWIAPQQEIANREKEMEDARIAMEERAELITDYIPINFGSAEEIAKLLTTESQQSQGGGAGQGTTGARGFLSPRGSVSFDRRTNTLLVNDIPPKLQEIRELIALLDRPVQQVLIESRIVIANESFARELGARFGVSGAREDGEGNIFTTAGSATGTDRMNGEGIRNRYTGRSRGLPVFVEPEQRGDPIRAPLLGERLNFNLPVSTPGAGSFALAILGADYLLDLELSALQAEGRGEVVSNPRVITANQQEAVIKQGREEGYQTTQVSGGVVQTTVNFKEILLELRVTPTITNDGRVFLALNVKKDEVAERIQTPQGTIPSITKREINTAVLVQNGETVVLGGVYEISSEESLQKVPLLGDVPVLGNLFRNKNRRMSKAELLIFVTPKLLRETLQ